MGGSKEKQEELAQQLGETLRRLLQERSITQRELANRVAVHPSTISKFVNGQGNPSVETLHRISEALGVNISAMMEGATAHRATMPEPDGTPIAGPLRVYIDSDAYSSDEKGELLSLISDLYFLQSNDRLVIDNKGTAEPVAVGTPNGGGSR